MTVIKVEPPSEFWWPSSSVSLTIHLLSYYPLKLQQQQHSGSEYMITGKIITAYEGSSCLEFGTLLKETHL